MFGDRATIPENLVRDIDRRLRVYGNSRHGNPTDPVDDLVYIILSMQTEEYSYRATFESLRIRHGGWEWLLSSPIDAIAAEIRDTGLQHKKAKYLQNATAKIVSDFGELSLRRLQDLTDAAVLKYLTSLPGISTKSARCIMLYTLGRQVFPVDTHVWRVSRRLGLTPTVPKPNEKRQEELEAKIPPDVRYSLHVNMVSHGRETCSTYWPNCESCILAELCPAKGTPDETWGQWRKPQGAWINYRKEKRSV